MKYIAATAVVMQLATAFVPYTLAGPVCGGGRRAATGAASHRVDLHEINSHALTTPGVESDEYPVSRGRSPHVSRQIRELLNLGGKHSQFGNVLLAHACRTARAACSK